MNYFELSIYFKKSLGIDVEFDLKLNTSNIFFPISWAYDISLNPTDKQVEDGEIAQYSFRTKVQLMPGSKLEVAEGAKLTSSNAIYVHMNKENISVGPNNVVIYGDETDTRLPFAYQVDVEDKDEEGNGLGTFHKEWRWELSERHKAAEFIVNGELSVHTLAGQVKSTNPGAIVTITNGTSYALHKVISHSNADKDSTVNSVAPTVYASLYGNAAIPTTGVAYMYNGTSWKYASVTANFETNGGNTIGSRPLNYNVSNGYYGTMPDNPTRTGYTFLGWYVDSAFTTLAVIENGYITNDINSTSITLYAKWVKNEITVEYNTDGGTISGVADTSLERSEIVSDSNVRYTVTLPTVYKTGYKFLGWYNGSTRVGGSGETYTFVANSLNYTNTVNLTAKWEIIDYTITYQNAVSTHPSFDSTALGLPGTFNANSVNHTLGTPTTDAEGWVFTEWYVIKDGTEHTITELNIATLANYADSESKLTIYCDWTQETVYTITFVQVVDGVETSISSMTGLECNNITYTASTFDEKSLPNLTGYNSLRSFAYEFKGFELVNGEAKATITRLEDVPETLVGTNFTINVIWEAKYELEFSINNGLSGDYLINITYSPDDKIYLNSTEINNIANDADINALKNKYSSSVTAMDNNVGASKHFKEWTSEVNSTAKTVTIKAEFDSKYVITVSGSNGGNTGYTITLSGTFYLTEEQLSKTGDIESALAAFDGTTKKYDSEIKANKYFDDWYTDSAKTSKFTGTFTKPASGKSITIYANWKTKHEIKVTNSATLDSFKVTVIVAEGGKTKEGTYTTSVNHSFFVRNGDTVTLSLDIDPANKNVISGYNVKYTIDGGASTSGTAKWGWTESGNRNVFEGSVTVTDGGKTTVTLTN